MKKEIINELYLNWKGLELVHSFKYFSKRILIILSIIFIFISVKINNTYLLLGALIVLFLQILSENNKEYYLKYKEIYFRARKESPDKFKDWINFLEKTKGINSFYKWLFGILFKLPLTPVATSSRLP